LVNRSGRSNSFGHPLNAPGVHPASNRFAYLASHFVNNLRQSSAKSRRAWFADPARNTVWITKNRRPKYHPTPLSGGDRKALEKEMTKARAMPLSDDALKIVTRGTEKDDRAAA
jgi:hypothetical protein